MKKVILFGSRTRDGNRERSDIDLAASGGNITNFYYDLLVHTYSDEQAAEVIKSEIGVRRFV